LPTTVTGNGADFAGESLAPLLEVENLSAGFQTEDGFLEAVDRVCFAVPRGGVVGLVGESGCGKSVTAHSILQLLPQPAGRITGGSIRLAGEDLLGLPEERIRAIRGQRIGMIFQEPMTALNPVQTIGRQVEESLHLHEWGRREERPARVLELLQQVGIPAAEERMRAYPHELSGGMRQRVVIAIALACQPDLLIADEPTTALDVTTQAQILALLARLRKELGMALILITHDLGVIAETCEEVVVMYAGRVVERGPVRRIFGEPRHRYTAGLLRSIPSLASAPKERLPTISGQVPALAELAVGARFAPRSDHPRIEEYLGSRAYREVRPELTEVAPRHWVEDCPFVRTDG
jgi:oligopeptide/dipeptide ABC transporter ATP-binding protein